MKKILIAFEGSVLPESAFNFVCGLNEVTPVLLTGVFLREASDTEGYEPSYYGGLGVPAYTPMAETFSDTKTKKSIKWFEEECRKNNIEYRIHNDTDDLIIHQVKNETRYADLLIISSEVFYGNTASSQPSQYLKSMLHTAECPVLVVPENMYFPESIILSYDGSESSVFSIKQFTYLFPELCNRRTVVVYASSDGKMDFPEEIQLEELVARHFSDLSFFKLYVDDKRTFSSWINEKKGALLVTGSYGRSEISELFKKSFVADIIREHRVPVFIAHK